MKCLHASDLHGNRGLYERLFRRVRDEGIETVFLSGDLTPLEPPIDHLIRVQGEFWTGWLEPRCRELRDDGVRFLVIPGNDDLGLHDERARSSEAWEWIDGTSTDVAGFRVLGSSAISASPFPLKDRELYDVVAGELAEPDAVDPFGAEVIRTVPADADAPTTTVETAISRLFEAMDDPGRPTILMAHCPPRGTRLDVIHDGRHVGSEGVRRAIEKFRPRLSLHGHIHESPGMPGGGWRDRVGETLCLNPGTRCHDGPDAPLQAIAFDLDDVEGTVSWSAGRE